MRIESVVLSPLHVAEVPAEQTGLLHQILVAEGAHVAAGEPLAELDRRAALLEVQQAKVAHEQAAARANNQVKIEYAEKSLEVARAELRRSFESIEKFANSISQSQLDVERLTVEKLELERRQAAHELELESFNERAKQVELAAAQLRLEQHRLVAPFAGTVALVRARLGEWLEVGEPVLRLVAVDRLRAVGFVAGETMGQLSLGQKVVFHATVGDVAITAAGTLQFISPEVDPVGGQVRIWAEIDNTRRQLRPGQQGVLELEESP